MKQFILSITILISGVFILSCEKDPEDVNPKAGQLTIQMNYVWGMNQSAFELGSDLIHPMTGDTLNFSTLKHYISNIALINSAGESWNATESYHLLDASNPSSLVITFNDVPTGTYSNLSITFGVDSTRNVSGVQEGALDPANNMFWSWNSGYIMMKAEGTSPQAEGNSFSYHIGGFSGENSAVIKKLLTYGSEGIQVNEDATTEIQVSANPAKLFHTYGSVSQGKMIHMPGPKTKNMAADFSGSFQINAVQ